VDLHAVVRDGGEEYCRAGVPAQAVFETTYREEQQNELTLVRESSMPVGSGRVFMYFSSNYRTGVLRSVLPISSLCTRIRSAFAAQPTNSSTITDFKFVSLFYPPCMKDVDA
jgi:hypothetical protein